MAGGAGADLGGPVALTRSGHFDRGRSGFTFVEILVVLAVVVLASLVGFPALLRMTQKARLTGLMQEMSVHIARARHEAIRRGVPVVVRPRLASFDLFAYANVDLDPAFDYDPDPSATLGTVDYELARLPLPSNRIIDFWGPLDLMPHGGDVVDGGTALSGAPNGIVFQPDGSVQAVGAIRIADYRGNFFEVRVAPAATGRVTVLKWNETPSWGGPAAFYEPGFETLTGANTWEWH